VFGYLGAPTHKNEPDAVNRSSLVSNVILALAIVIASIIDK